jgi:hypothetical protein
LKVQGFDLCGILSPLIFSEGIFVFIKLRFYKNYLVGKEAAMGRDIGDAPFNSISLFIFYYAIDGKIEERN